MKRILPVLFSLLIGIPAFSEQMYEMKSGAQYMFFSNDSIKSVKSNNPSLISAQRVQTYLGTDNQIVFQTKDIGKADIQIETNKDTKVYSIIIKADNPIVNDTFVELDIPEGIQ